MKESEMHQTNFRANTIYNTVKTLLGILYPLITFPYISRVLMAENIGKINFANSIVNYFLLVASLGVTPYAVRECAKLRNNQEKLNQTASQIFSINVVSTFIAYLALVITLVVSHKLHNYGKLIVIYSSTLLLTTIGTEWINTAMEDFRYISIRTCCIQILSILLMFVLVKRPDDYYLYAVISVLASGGSNIINVFYRRKYCSVRFTFRMDVKKHLPAVLLLFAMTLSQIIYTNSDTTIIGLTRSDFEVGLYSIVVKIYHLINTTIASVAWVVMPQLSACFSQKDYKSINQLLKYSLNFIIVLGLPCIIGVNVFAKPIIYLIAGQEYLGAANALHIFTATLLFSLVGGWIGNMMMLPAGKERICLLVGGISALINITLNLVFIPFFGINAAAATTAIAELVNVVILSRYVDKSIKINGLWKMLKAPLVGSLLIALISCLARLLITSYTWLAAIGILLSIVVYAVCLILLKNEFILSFLHPIKKK